MESNRQIGMAVGILMARKLWTSDQAFAQLQTASQHLNRKLADIAAEVTTTGALPDFRPKKVRTVRVVPPIMAGPVPLLPGGSSTP